MTQNALNILVHCLAQGHFSMWTGGARNLTTDFMISGLLPLPPEPSYNIFNLISLAHNLEMRLCLYCSKIAQQMHERTKKRKYSSETYIHEFNRLFIKRIEI